LPVANGPQLGGAWELRPNGRYLYRSGQKTVEFSDLDNAHAYITGHGIELDFIEYGN
jgi:hypothetical protein